MKNAQSVGAQAVKQLTAETRIALTGTPMEYHAGELCSLFDILLLGYLPRYNEEQRRRHEVRPGLSGLAQVNGRNTVSWQDKFLMGVEYVDHITFLGDLKIIWDSVMVAFIKRDGISSETSVTMEEFLGNGTAVQ